MTQLEYSNEGQESLILAWQSEEYPLHKAASLNWFGVVNNLLFHSGNKYQVNSEECVVRTVDFYCTYIQTPLDCAIEGGKESERLVLFLLRNGGECKRYRDVILNKMVERNYLEATEYLIKNTKCDLNKRVKNEDGFTSQDPPLHDARSKEMVELLLKYGARIDSYSLDRLPIHSCCMKNSVAAVQTLLQLGADVNSKDRAGRTPLHEVRFEGVSMVSFLIDSGAQVNSMDNQKQTPLHIAAEVCDLPVAKILIANGAQVNSIDHKGRTPLHRAAGWSKLPMLRFLIAKGAKVNSIDHKGRTPLHRAAGWGHFPEVELLIFKGAKVNSIDHRGRTPLHLAAAIAHFPVAKLLIARGAEVHATNKSRGNVLHHLKLDYSSNSRKFLKAAMDRGVDIDAQDDAGLTPLHCAKQGVEFLIRLGANINIESNEGLTPLEMLHEKEKEEYEIALYEDDNSHEHYYEAIKYLANHAIRLKVANIHVSGKNLRSADLIKKQLEDREFGRSLIGDDEVHVHQDRALSCRLHYKNCERELIKLESYMEMRVNTFLALRDLDYIANMKLRKRLQKMDGVKYPIYSELIKHKFARDRDRFALLQACKTMFAKSKLEPTLPGEMWKKILLNLPNVDLRQVARVKPFSKAMDHSNSKSHLV